MLQSADDKLKMGTTVVVRQLGGQVGIYLANRPDGLCVVMFTDMSHSLLPESDLARANDATLQQFTKDAKCFYNLRNFWPNFTEHALKYYEFADYCSDAHALILAAVQTMKRGGRVWYRLPPSPSTQLKYRIWLLATIVDIVSTTVSGSDGYHFSVILDVPALPHYLTSGTGNGPSGNRRIILDLTARRTTPIIDYWLMPSISEYIGSIPTSQNPAEQTPETSTFAKTQPQTAKDTGFCRRQDQQAIEIFFVLGGKPDLRLMFDDNSTP